MQYNFLLPLYSSALGFSIFIWSDIFISPFAFVYRRDYGVRRDDEKRVLLCGLSGKQVSSFMLLFHCFYFCHSYFPRVVTFTAGKFNEIITEKLINILDSN
jgi:hypothetical protein